MIGLGVFFPIILGFQTYFQMRQESDAIEDPTLFVNQTDREGALPVTVGNLLMHHPKQILTATMLGATLQLTGINAVMFYGPKIIKSAGFENGNLLNIYVGAWNFVTTLFAIFLVNKLGRRLLFLVGTALLTVALLGIGFTFTFTETCAPPANKTQLEFDFMQFPQADPPAVCPRVVGVSVGLAVFILGFEIGPGCLFWVLANEIFPRSFSDLGASYTNIVQWGFNLLVSSTFALLQPESLGFYLFGGFGVICTIYLFFFLRVSDTPSSRSD